MKSIVRILVALAILGLLIASCASPATPQPSAQQTQPPAAQETQAPQPAAAEPVKLVVWWWGEQEAPGAQKWMDETIAMYQKEHPNVTFEAVLQSTDTLIPSF